MSKELYKTDLNLWYQQTLKALSNKDTKGMDWDNLIQEIEDMGASQKRALKSYTKRLLHHILKLEYWESQKDRCSKKWQVEITNFRQEILDILDDSPSLKNYLEREYPKIQKQAIALAEAEFTVPDDCSVNLPEALGVSRF